MQPPPFIVLPLAEFCRKNNFPTDAQRNRQNEIFLVTNGYLIRNLNLNSIRINRHDLHVSLTDQISAMESCSEDIDGFYCAFDNDLPDEVYTKDDVLADLAFINSFMSRYPLRLPEAVLTRLNHTFSVLTVLAASPENNLQLIHTYLVTIICEIKQVMLPLNLNPYPTKAFLIAKQYNDLLVKYITSQRDIEFYASRIGITPNHLNKSVKAVTGKTAVMIRNEMTLFEAKLQLRQNYISIGELAYNLGFSEAAYFSRFFKKATGYTPLEYREIQK